MKQNPESIELLTQSAERLLWSLYGPTVRLGEPTVIARRDRSLTLRCATSGWRGVASVVIKRNDGDDERGFNDWASLQFLSEVGDATLAPRFHAGSAVERFVVMQDLGMPNSLEQILATGDKTATMDAVKSLAVTMARLIIATIGKESHFLTLRQALPGSERLGRVGEAARWRESIDRVRRWAEALAIRLPAGFDEACHDVASTFADPGPWLAFSHGDPAPSNSHVSGNVARLIDFEYAGYRHALYDLTGWNTLCPLPESWLDEMRRVFRDELGRHREELPLVDDEAFRRGWGAMCAYRALAIMSWLPTDLLDADRPWAVSWSSRAALLTAARRLQLTTTDIAGLEPFAEFGARMHKTLRKHWPKESDDGPDWLPRVSRD